MIEINKEQNRFYQNRLEIKKMLDEEHKNIAEASNLLVSIKDWSNYEQELNDWLDLCRYYSVESEELTLENLFV